MTGRYKGGLPDPNKTGETLKIISKRFFSIDDTICYAIKSSDYEYYCGYDKRDKQLRKSRLYTRISMRDNIKELFKHKICTIIKVKISEIIE